jgi:HD-like signal output (HDOD) protein
MDKAKKMELLRRSLGIRHKLKVHESTKQPETHEEIATMLLSKWELEDELRAIEEILADARQENTAAKRKSIEEHIDSEEKMDQSAKKRKAKGV